MNARADAKLIDDLERAHIHPLWDRYKRITPVAPQATDAPMHWRWRDVEPFTARAAQEVAIEDVERRALILANPAFAGKTITTQNLIGAFTVLEPGDKAVPHRHTAAAIRFATRADGAVTIVNGRRCEMHEGDLVLTPPMCWHGHINESEHRTVWFDAANMPAVCMLDASFFEPGTRHDERFWEVATEGSSEYRFPGADTRRDVARAARGKDGARTYRYTRNGGSVMPTL
ncbi:MAG: cupin domain-containing protein, partial [Burkholderia sp.]|nr:cupin domain-containing protein [Burkholderia sp.]